MKNLFTTFLAILLFASCNLFDNQDINDDPSNQLPKEFYGSWTEVDQYLEFKIRNGNDSWNTITNIKYHIEEDGTYLVENDCEFGLPIGTGTWDYNSEFKFISFTPSSGIDYDTSLNFYWKNIIVDDLDLEFDYYHTKTKISENGWIESNRIPRRFKKH